MIGDSRDACFENNADDSAEEVGLSWLTRAMESTGGMYVLKYRSRRIGSLEKG
jgi:hypothetical protein